ncbi:MAG: hypothetical protein ACRDS1_01910 [Pseudonocardiaceae bacterium]
MSPDTGRERNRRADEHDRRAHPERARLYAQAHRISNGAGCVLLVIQTDDGWAIHGMDLPGEPAHVCVSMTGSGRSATSPTSPSWPPW